MTRRLGLSLTRPKASLLTLMLLVSVATGVFVYSDPRTTLSQDEDPSDPFNMGDSTFELAEELLSLLGASHAHVRAALDRLVDEGVVIPEATEDVFRSGEEAAAAAYYYMGIGDYQSVIEKATEALQLFGDAIQIAVEAGQAPTEDEGEGDATLVELQVRIERGYSFLFELYDTACQLGEKGLDISDVQTLLEKASEHLESASILLEEGSLEAVEFELAMAEVYLDEALKLLQIINEDAKLEKASKFLTKSEERVQKLEERITTMVGNFSLTQEDIDLLGDSFDYALVKNRDIKTLIEEGDLDTALVEFEEVSRYIDKVLSMLDRYDSSKSNNLKKIEKIETKHSYLEEAVESLGVQGVNVSQLGDKVEEADEKIEDAIESLTNDDDDLTTGALIDEAEDLVEEVDDTICKLKKPKSNNGNKGNNEKPSGNEGGNSNPSSNNKPANDNKPCGNEGGKSNPSSNNKSSKVNRKHEPEEPKP